MQLSMVSWDQREPIVCCCTPASQMLANLQHTLASSPCLPMRAADFLADLAATSLLGTAKMGGKRCLACLHQHIGKTPPASGFCCSLTTGVATGVAAVGGRGAGPGGEDSLPGITPVYDGISEVDDGFHCRVQMDCWQALPLQQAWGQTHRLYGRQIKDAFGKRPVRSIWHQHNTKCKEFRNPQTSLFLPNCHTDGALFA